MADNLKPCPFCGGEATIIGDDYYWCQCLNCWAETLGSEDVQQAIEYWNRRAEDGKRNAAD